MKEKSYFLQKGVNRNAATNILSTILWSLNNYKNYVLASYEVKNILIYILIKTIKNGNFYSFDVQKFILRAKLEKIPQYNCALGWDICCYIKIISEGFL